MWWQWIALPVLGLAALVIGRVLGALTAAFLHRISARTATEWDDRLLKRTAPALTLLWGVAVAALLLPWLALLPGAHGLARGPCSAATVGLAYGTTEEQVRRVITGIEAMLRANPRVWPDVVVARLAALGASSLDVEVLCWFQTSDFALFRDLRQEALLGIMRIVAEAGTSFAFPTQTLHVVDAKDPSRAPRSG
jgi:small-conductance mechanosensitive channel